MYREKEMKKFILLSACALFLCNAENSHAAAEEGKPLLGESPKSYKPVSPKEEKGKLRPRGSGKSPVRSPKGPIGLAGLSSADALRELGALD